MAANGNGTNGTAPRDLLANPMRLARSGAKWLLKRTILADAVFDPARHQRPLLVRFDINNRCNQLCAKCFYPAYTKLGIPPHSIFVDDFKRIAERVFPHAYYLQLPFGFEPLLHPQFDQLVQIADDYEVPNIGIVTNGVLLNGKRAEALLNSRNVSAIAISVDAVDHERYKRLRGQDHLDVVLRNITEFIDARKKAGREFPVIYTNTLILRSNLDHLDQVFDRLVEMDVDEMQFFHCEPIERSNDESILNAVDEYNELHDRLGAKTAGLRQRVYLPPRIEPCDFDAHGAFTRRFTQGGRTSEFETSSSQAFDEQADHPYPTNIHCICPWMVMILDSWGNLFPCAHRNEPYANLLRDDMLTGYNSIKLLNLRRDLMNGERNGPCATCRSKSPSSDPLKRKVTRRLPAGEVVS